MIFALLGFLPYNLNPAKVFMGDTGSLALGGIFANLNIPFTNISIPLSFAYVIFIVFWQVGFSNAVNLTDGLDGLATGLSIIGFTMYAIMSFVLDSPAIGAFCIIMIFALLGFLPYNLNPAKVFMGDTGSLALGGIFA
ncbi:hypothetical protein EF900_18430, partial [Staphylococcus aureus]